MTTLAGNYFDGASSRRRPAEAQLAGGAVRVQVDGRELEPPTPLELIEVSSRIGNTPRFLRFPSGGSFETADNDAVDRALAARRLGRGLAHRLESRLRVVLLGLVVTIAFVWGTIQWGVPALAKVAAEALPPHVNQHMDGAVLSALDRQLLHPSTLDEDEQARLLTVFAPFLDEVDPAYRLRVLFRDAGHSIGPNALALPSGTVIFTDQLVELAERDEELIGVLAHEIGHVVGRHGMRQTLQASALGLLAVLVVGDVSSVSSAVIALPLLLTELGYTRNFEREADRYALATLARHDIDAAHLAAILQRLGGEGEEPGEWSGYLSTHPPTAERLQYLAP
ncbi:M48 family metallopeptidase [Ectothiorhodospiraceae bacterium 2226]|nr:M48 family metallopeptidase [Ectothiorhodospiraceae bacterium 2226]